MLRSPSWILCVTLLTTSCAPAPSKIAASAARAGEAPVTRPRVERVVAHAGGALALATLDDALVAYVADEDDRRLLLVDVDTQSLLGETALDGAPAQIVTLPHARVAVALRDRAQIAVFEGVGTPQWQLREVGRVDVAAEPFGVATTPDDTTLLVTSGWGHALSVISLPELHVRFAKELGREPRGVVSSRDGKRAFVAHAVGNGLSIVDLADAAAKPKVWFLEAES